MRGKSVLLALFVLLVLGIGAWRFYQLDQQAAAAHNALEASYQNHFFSLIENVENLDVLLGKVLASNSNDQNIMTLVTVWSLAEAAKSNLDNLPLDTVNMMRSNLYLSQLGDYAYSMAQALVNRQEIPDSDWRRIKELHQQNRIIHNELRNLLGLLQDRQIRLGSLKNASPETKMTPDSEELLKGFGKLDERLQNEVPTLTYDGPFSDHVVNRQPRGLTGEEIDEKEAERTALEFAGNLDTNTKYSAKVTGAAEGRIPAYSVTLQPEDKAQSDLTLGISKKGGHVVFMIARGEKAEISRVSMEDAKKRAAEFASKLGLGTFMATGHLTEGNELLVNFALIQDNVIIYPDMVQVIVSLDSGNIAAYDANKFLLSHTQRTLPEPKISEQEARARVNKNLNIEEVRLALIPLDNLQEKLTYEVKGKIDEDTYYVYINAETGFQEKILLIVETPQGSRSL